MVAITDTDRMGHPVWIWDVSYSVGSGCPNCMDDTALVQTMLNILIPYLGLPDYSQRLETDPSGETHYAPLAALVVDGFWGVKTNEAIISFQEQFGYLDNHKGFVQPASGLINRGLEGPLYVQASTIWMLNVKVLESRNKMLDVPDFPPAFQGYFSHIG